MAVHAASLCLCLSSPHQLLHDAWIGPLLQPEHLPYIPSSATAQHPYSTVINTRYILSQTSRPSLSSPQPFHTRQQHCQPIHALATAHSPRDPPIDSTSSTMPTPDETAFPPSPPIDIPARSQFASCPPEEERESQEDSDEDGDETTAAAESDDHAIAQEPTPEPEAIAGASRDTRAQSKEQVDDVTATNVRAPSPVASPDAVAPEGEMQAQASSSTDAPVTFPPEYLDFPPNKQRVCAIYHSEDRASLTGFTQLIPNSSSSFLRPGSKFKGTQQSDRQVYDVQVEIKDVDMAESSLSGYLRIQGKASSINSHTQRTHL